MTYTELVCCVAAFHGHEELSDDDADWILWNRTGFPSFLAPAEGETVLDVLVRQVEDAILRPQSDDEVYADLDRPIVDEASL